MTHQTITGTFFAVDGDYPLYLDVDDDSVQLQIELGGEFFTISVISKDELLRAILEADLNYRTKN